MSSNCITDILPDIDFKLLRNGLLYFDWHNKHQIMKQNPRAITIYYKYIYQPNSQNINKEQYCSWKSVRHSKSIKHFNRTSSNQTHTHYSYITINSANLDDGKYIDCYKQIYLYIVFELSYKDKRPSFISELISIPIVIKSYIKQILHKSKRRKKYQYDYHYIIHHLSRKNISYIISYWQTIFLKNNHLTHNDIKTLISKYTPAKDGILCINSRDSVTLESDYEYEFDSIFIGENALLTVSAYNPDTDIGGKLLLCSLTNIHNHGTIDLSGCGYRNDMHTSKSESMHYHRGIGAGNNGKCGSGGGYGTMGNRAIKLGNKHYKKSKGGIVYGDEKLSTLHLGSSGGNGMDRTHHYSWQPRTQRNHIGSAGGGALLLKCYQYDGVCYGVNNGVIVVKGSIKCDGEHSTYWGGAGSGGSIKIQCNQFVFERKPGSVFSVSGGESKACRKAQELDPRRSHIRYYDGAAAASNRFRRFYSKEFKLYRKYKFGNGGIGRIYIETNDECFYGNGIVDENGHLRLRFQ